MLRMAMNISWKQKLTNKQLYQELPKITDVIAERRLRLAGHCIRHSEEIANILVLWEPTKGNRSRGRQAVNYIDVLKKDTQLEEAEEIRTAMMNRIVWKKWTKSGRAGAK